MRHISAGLYKATGVLRIFIDLPYITEYTDLQVVCLRRQSCYVYFTITSSSSSSS